MPTDLLSYWGEENLRKLSRASLANISIPQTAKEFLERVGLPVIDDPLFRFVPDAHPFLLLDKARCYRRVGVFDSSPICVQEGEGGVYWYDEENHAAKFMNSTLETFALLLTQYQQMLVESRSASHAERRRIVSESEEQMRSIDPAAFANEESYWPVVFEQIGYELS